MMMTTSRPPPPRRPAPTRLRIPRLKPLSRDLLDDYDSFDFDNSVNPFAGFSGFAGSARARRPMARLGGMTNAIDDYEDLLFEDYDNNETGESAAASGSKYLTSEV